MRPLAERFMAKVSPEPNSGCWLWTGAGWGLGYGRITRDGHRIAYAHRIAWELANGPIPAGLQLDHLCRNPSCVNPAHLEPVTSRENTLRGRRGVLCELKQLCRNGHLRTKDNVYRNGNCRECALLRMARIRAERRATWIS